MLGIYLDYKYFVDTRNGEKYSYVFTNLFEELNGFEDYGVVINGLIKTSVWVELPMSDYLGEITLPLKFSYNGNARYNLLSASEIAENQGYFIEEEEEDW